MGRLLLDWTRLGRRKAASCDICRERRRKLVDVWRSRTARSRFDVRLRICAGCIAAMAKLVSRDAINN
jgi:hypothetical protein